MAEELYFMQEFGGCRVANETKHKFRGKFLFPPHYKRFSDKILKTPVRKDDVWLLSYPRTGSTWCQEIIWLIVNNLDFLTARTTLQQLRVMLIEASYGLKFQYVDSVKMAGYDLPIPRYTNLKMDFDLIPERLNRAQLEKAFGDSAGYMETLPSPRCMRSHLCAHLLPEGIETVKPKVIYIMREPKDLCVSYYFYLKLGHNFTIDFEDFCELFLNDALPCGSVFHHYFDFWNKRHEPNYLILRYEEMLANPKEMVRRIASHLNKTLNDEDVDDISEYAAFRNMKDNKACNLEILVDNTQGKNYYKKTDSHFIRKGQVGDYKNYMSQEMIERFDKWIEANTKGTDLTF